MTERRYRLTVAALPAPSDRRELLELVLAAASVDLRLEVVLLGSACRLLSGADAAGWRQLVEMGLAELWIEEDAWTRAHGDQAIGWPHGVRRFASESRPGLPAADVGLQV